MARLFAQQDLAFVSARSGTRRAVRRLRRERCAVMQLYVRQMRRDFHRVWSVCRLLAPVSQNADLSVLLIRQYVVFHALCAVLYLRCLAGWYGYADFEIRILVGALNHLRVCAANALQSGEAFAFQAAATRAS